MSFLYTDFFPFFRKIKVAVIDPPYIVSRAVNKFYFKIIGRRFGFNIKCKFIIIGEIYWEQFLYSAVTSTFGEIIIETDRIAC